MVADLRLRLRGTPAVTGVSRHWLPIGAGAIAGVSTWAVNMQLGQILPYAECSSRFYPEVLISFAAAGVSMIFGWISWRSARCGATANRTGRFAATVSALLGLMFAFALLLQAASTLILTGCER
jgi:hypothetical protein